MEKTVAQNTSPSLDTPKNSHPTSVASTTDSSNSEHSPRLIKPQPPALNQLLDDLEDAGKLDDPSEVLAGFAQWAADGGRPLYPHQEAALTEIFQDHHVIAATPTGSGKTMIALGAHLYALAQNQRSYYTAPLKALVSEKFFDLIGLFGAANVGMITGDAAVNAEAPIICCTAEILANQALSHGPELDVGTVIMDEFHFYDDAERGGAWQIPLLELKNTQFVLLSATLGKTDFFQQDLFERTGRECVLIDQAKRPVPLRYNYSYESTTVLLERLVASGQYPIYLVHFSQIEAVQSAESLANASLTTKEQRQALAQELKNINFGTGFGKILSRLLHLGIGVHHAGMLPRYRRLVERLAQAGLLVVICGTDTLGVGINVPIRTVVLTSLVKFDGQKTRHLAAREFHQICGRAGRAGFDQVGYVEVQAPEEARGSGTSWQPSRPEVYTAAGLDSTLPGGQHPGASSTCNEGATIGSSIGSSPGSTTGKGKKNKKTTKSTKNSAGTKKEKISWNAATFERLLCATPEQLRSRFQIDHSLVLNVLSGHPQGAAHLYWLVKNAHPRAGGAEGLFIRLTQVLQSLLQTEVIAETGQFLYPLESLEEKVRVVPPAELQPQLVASTRAIFGFDRPADTGSDTPEGEGAEATVESVTAAPSAGKTTENETSIPAWAAELAAESTGYRETEKADQEQGNAVPSPTDKTTVTWPSIIPEVKLVHDLPDNFALNQELSPFALAALEILDPDSADYDLDLISTVEAVLEDPRPLLIAQEKQLRDQLYQQLRYSDLEFNERQNRLAEVTWPRPLADILEPAFRQYRQVNPWVAGREISPKSVVRLMVENSWSFSDLIRNYNLVRSEGVVLRYLSDAYRALDQIVTAEYRSETFNQILTWLGDTVRSIDSSLLDEWQALHNNHLNTQNSIYSPANQQLANSGAEPRAFGVDEAGRIDWRINQAAVTATLRNQLWKLVELFDFDDPIGLAKLNCQDFAGELWTEDDWADLLDDFFEEFEQVDISPAARSPQNCPIIFSNHEAAALLQRWSDLPLPEHPDSRWVAATQLVDDGAETFGWRFIAGVDLNQAQPGEPLPWHLVYAGTGE